MNGITEHDQRAGGLVKVAFLMGFAMIGMAVTPQEEFFQEEESEDPKKDRPQDLLMMIRTGHRQGIREEIEEGNTQ
jgi:hypothetical protein